MLNVLQMSETALKTLIREINFHLHILHVGKLQAQQLVLGGELKLSICLNAILTQGPMRLEKPSSLLFSPQSMVRPIFFYIEFFHQFEHHPANVHLPSHSQGDIAVQVRHMNAQFPRPIRIAAIWHPYPVQSHGSFRALLALRAGLERRWCRVPSSAGETRRPGRATNGTNGIRPSLPLPLPPRSTPLSPPPQSQTSSLLPAPPSRPPRGRPPRPSRAVPRRRTRGRGRGNSRAGEGWHSAGRRAVRGEAGAPAAAAIRKLAFK